MPSPPEPAPPRPPAASRSYLAEEEARRLLSTANVHLRRGQTADAERVVRDALAATPDDAGAQEMLGDIRLAQGAFDDAVAAYRAALVKEPGRVTAEAKLARATLRQSETQRKETLGVAYAASSTALMRSGNEDDRGRRSRLAVASAFLPGLGQIMGGAYVKGGLIIGVAVLSWLLLSVAAGNSLPIILGMALRLNFSRVGGLTLFALLLMTLDWLYAVVDAAALSARKDSN